MHDDIHMSIDIRAPLERVWEAVSTEQRLRDWLNPNMSIEPRVGGRVEYPGQHLHESFTYAGKVVSLDPEHELAFEWNATSAPWPEPTRVTISLTEHDDDVCVTLQHTGWEQLPEAAREAIQQVWSGDELVPLKELVEGAGPTT